MPENNDPLVEARQALARARADIAYTLGDGNRTDLERVAGDRADTIGDEVLVKLAEADDILASAST